MTLDGPVLQLEIAQIRVNELRFDISPSLRLPNGSVDTREYVVFETVVENGSTGTAYVLTRGAPVYEAADDLASRLVGRSLEHAVARSAIQGGRLPFQRASALADICVWDLAGKDASVPTWRLVGTDASRRKALAVAGYRRSGETVAEFAGRVQELVSGGIKALKIAHGEGSQTQELLAAIRSTVGDRIDLIVDVGFAATSVEQVVTSMEAWRPYGLAWVEDPFPTSNAKALADVRRVSGMALAAGDEAPPSDVLRILENDAVDVIRLDVTTLGGISGLINLAARSDRRISLHIYPEFHRHIASVLPQVEEIELFLPHDPFDFVDRFIKADAMDIEDGYLVPPLTPGLGLAFEPSGVESRITRSSHHGSA